jgi:alcohol dehydrogenase class IV
MQSGTYRYLAQDHVTYGVAAATAVAQEVEQVGAARVLIVASRSLAGKTPVVEEIRAALDDRVAGVFDGCREHTPIGTVIDCVDAIRAAKADLVVTLGGGTPIDTVKAALVCLAENVDDPAALLTYRVQVDPQGRPRIPPVAPSPVRQVAVPTTLSGAEFSNLAGVTDPARGIKDAYFGRDSIPISVILDPAVSIHTPEYLWISTGVRAVDHAVETICSRAPQPLPDAAAIHALRLFAAALPRSRNAPDDRDARLDCQLAVWLATMGLGRVPYGASHGIGHQLGAVASVPHGRCSCVMLPSVLRYNAAVNADRQALVSEAMGRPGDPAGDVVEAFVASLGQPTRLRDAGVAADQLDTIAAGSLENMMVRSNPRPVETAAQIREILDMAW